MPNTRQTRKSRQPHDLEARFKRPRHGLARNESPTTCANPACTLGQEENGRRSCHRESTACLPSWMPLAFGQASGSGKPRQQRHSWLVYLYLDFHKEERDDQRKRDEHRRSVSRCPSQSSFNFPLDRFDFDFGIHAPLGRCPSGMEGKKVLSGTPDFLFIEDVCYDTRRLPPARRKSSPQSAIVVATNRTRFSTDDTTRFRSGNSALLDNWLGRHQVSQLVICTL